MSFHPIRLQQPGTVDRKLNLKMSDSGTGYIMQQSVQLSLRLHTKLERYEFTESSNILYIETKFH
jgi:hypothetical protein